MGRRRIFQKYVLAEKLRTPGNTCGLSGVIQVFIIVSACLVVAGCADSHDSAGDQIRDVVRCRGNLEFIHGLLVEAGKRIGKLPLDSKGSIDLEELFRSFGIASGKERTCPASPGFKAYIFRRNLTLDDIVAPGKNKYAILAMDDLWNHSKPGDEKVKLNLLNADGLVLQVIRPSNVAREWIKKLRNGEVFEID